jgi:predicted RNase H-like nuclease (RuvC/YqgF family)
LAPSEVPVDRVVALSVQLEMLAAQNRDLCARIKELEANGATREQALNEAVRDAEAATAEATRLRAQVQSLRAENAALQLRLQQMEEEDIRTLRAMIAVLERILNAPPGRVLP